MSAVERAVPWRWMYSKSSIRPPRQHSSMQRTKWVLICIQTHILTTYHSVFLPKPTSNWPNCGWIVRSTAACPRLVAFISSVSMSRTDIYPQLIRDLHIATSGGDGDDQSQKGTQLLEIYALEIQMYNETRNFKKLKVSRIISSHI